MKKKNEEMIKIRNFWDFWRRKNITLKLNHSILCENYCLKWQSRSWKQNNWFEQLAFPLFHIFECLNCSSLIYSSIINQQYCSPSWEWAKKKKNSIKSEWKFSFFMCTNSTSLNHASIHAFNLVSSYSALNRASKEKKVCSLKLQNGIISFDVLSSISEKKTLCVFFRGNSGLFFHLILCLLAHTQKKESSLLGTMR